VLWFVLATGARWEDVPEELGCSGRTAHRRLRAWEEAGIWDRLHADLLSALKRAGKLDLDTVIIDGVTVRAFGGGESTGPSPVDRRKPGTKHTIMVNKAGVPLAIRTAGANASDHRQILPVVVRFPKVKGTPGRPKELPDELYADRGYDSEALRALLRWLGIEPHVAKRGTPHGSGLGKVRCRGRADDQLAQGAASVAGAGRPARRDHGCLGDAGGERHLLPDPPPRRYMKERSFVRACYARLPLGERYLKVPVLHGEFPIASEDRSERP
jgi:transposase